MSKIEKLGQLWNKIRPSAESRRTPTAPSAVPSASTEMDPRLDTYIGGDNSELIPNCPHCGKGYGTQYVAVCGSCGQGRHVYAVNMPPIQPSQIVTPDLEQVPERSTFWPDFGSKNVNIESDVDLPKVVGHQVTIGESCDVAIVGGNLVKIGDYFNGTTLAIRSGHVGDNVDIDNVVAGSSQFGDYAGISLLVIPDGAEVVFGHNASIDILVTGKGTKVSFGDYAEIGSHLSLGEYQPDIGSNSSIAQSQVISQGRYDKIIHKCLLPFKPSKRNMGLKID